MIKVLNDFKDFSTTEWIVSKNKEIIRKRKIFRFYIEKLKKEKDF
ncbi:hypothetical protein R4Z10_15540 [Niallia sp. XMNu-256]